MGRWDDGTQGMLNAILVLFYYLNISNLGIFVVEMLRDVICVPDDETRLTTHKQWSFAG